MVEPLKKQYIPTLPGYIYFSSLQGGQLSVCFFVAEAIQPLSLCRTAELQYWEHCAGLEWVGLRGFPNVLFSWNKEPKRLKCSPRCLSHSGRLLFFSQSWQLCVSVLTTSFAALDWERGAVRKASRQGISLQHGFWKPTKTLQNNSLKKLSQDCTSGGMLSKLGKMRWVSCLSLKGCSLYTS